MQPTNISWATYTWNPETGCSRTGPTCFDAEADEPKCYAEILSRRQGWTDSPWTVANADENVTMYPDRLTEPDDYHWPEGPGRVLVGSMTDMFHSETDPEFVREALEVCRRHREILWIWLTKRPQNAADWRLDWPQNCMLGVSVGSAGRDYPSTTHQIEQLRDVDVGLKWVSFEPLLEPMPDLALDHIDWVVVGGESPADASTRREMDHRWAVDILKQCHDAHIPYYFKQSSGVRPETGIQLSVPNDEHGHLEQRRIREFPKLPSVILWARQNGEVMA